MLGLIFLPFSFLKKTFSNQLVKGDFLGSNITLSLLNTNVPGGEENNTPGKIFWEDTSPPKGLWGVPTPSLRSVHPNTPSDTPLDFTITKKGLIFLENLK